MAGTLTQLLEYTHGTGHTLRVDREKGVIHGVKLLGEASANPPPRNNYYPPETRRKAAALLEGARVYVDHAPRGQERQTRSYRDAFGLVRGVEERGDGLYGDFHFNPKSPLAEQLIWDAENNPRGVGFSISADGRTRPHDGRQLVEEIVSVDSVDLVSRPATTKGLHESLESPVKKTLKQLLEALKARPEYKGKPSLKALQEMDDAGMVPEAAPVEEPAADESHEDALLKGFRAAWAAIFDDDSLDTAGKIQKAKDLLKTVEKLMGGGAAEPPPDGGMEESLTAAGNKSVAKLAERFELRIKARDLCSDAGVVPTKTLRKALDACGSEAEMAELIQEHKSTPRSAAPNQTPRSAPAKAGGTTAVVEAKAPEDPAALKRWLQE